MSSSERPVIKARPWGKTYHFFRTWTRVPQRGITRCGLPTIGTDTKDLRFIMEPRMCKTCIKLAAKDLTNQH